MTDFNGIQFPYIKNVHAKLLADDIKGMTAPECAEAMGKMLGDVHLQLVKISYLDKVAKELQGEYYSVFRDEMRLVIEEEWIFNGCKNDDDACDYARDIGEEVVKKYPALEITETFAHRHKYSIVELKIKPE